MHPRKSFFRTEIGNLNTHCTCWIGVITKRREWQAIFARYYTVSLLPYDWVTCTDFHKLKRKSVFQRHEFSRNKLIYFRKIIQKLNVFIWLKNMLLRWKIANFKQNVSNTFPRVWILRFYWQVQTNTISEKRKKYAFIQRFNRRCFILKNLQTVTS